MRQGSRDRALTLPLAQLRSMPLPPTEPPARARSGAPTGCTKLLVAEPHLARVGRLDSCSCGRTPPQGSLSHEAGRWETRAVGAVRGRHRLGGRGAARGH